MWLSALNPLKPPTKLVPCQRALHSAGGQVVCKHRRIQKHKPVLAQTQKTVCRNSELGTLGERPSKIITCVLKLVIRLTKAKSLVASMMNEDLVNFEDKGEVLGGED